MTITKWDSDARNPISDIREAFKRIREDMAPQPPTPEHRLIMGWPAAPWFSNETVAFANDLLRKFDETGEEDEQGNARLKSMAIADIEAIRAGAKS